MLMKLSEKINNFSAKNVDVHKKNPWGYGFVTITVKRMQKEFLTAAATAVKNEATVRKKRSVSEWESMQIRKMFSCHFGVNSSHK